MNIIDYAENCATEEFSERGFCLVDGLIFSQLSYLKFDGIIKGPSGEDEGLVMSSIMKHKKYEQLYRDERYAENNRRFFEALCNSKRYGGLILNNYINAIDDNLDIQFSAMTITDGKGFKYLVFRGTDDNMVGWKEDLNMTFKMPIPSQKYSVEYLEKIAEKWDGDFYIGGHSKGGNLAVYSAMNASEETRNRIIQIHSYDGPGFRTELIRNSCYENIKNKIRKLVPKACVIGMFGNVEKIEVVDCEGFGGVIQHNPFNWVVEGNDFKRTEHMDRLSELRSDAVYMWASEMDDEQWALLSDKLFAVIEDAGIKNLNEFYSDFFGTMAKMKEAANRLDDDSKEKISDMLSMFRDSAKEVAKEEARGGVSLASEKAHSATSSAKHLIMQAIETHKEKAIDAKYTKLN